MRADPDLEGIEDLRLYIKILQSMEQIAINKLQFLNCK